MFLLNMILTILAFAGINIMYKISQLRKCESWVFLSSMYAVACVSSVIVLFSKNDGLEMPGKVLAMGVGTGLASALCTISVLRALKVGGKLSLVTVVAKLSLSVPVVYSMLFLGEKMTRLRIIGLALFVIFVILLQEPEKAVKKEAPS